MFTYLSFLVDDGHRVLQLDVVEQAGQENVGHADQTVVLLLVEERVGALEIGPDHLQRESERKNGARRDELRGRPERKKCVQELNLSQDSQSTLHHSPSTPGRVPACPPAGSPFSPEPRSASLCLSGGPGWLARSALHLSTHRVKTAVGWMFLFSFICFKNKQKQKVLYLPVGVQVGSRYLQSDQVFRLLVKLLSYEASFLCQQVGPNDLLFKPPQAASHHRFSEAFPHAHAQVSQYNDIILFSSS